MKSNTADRKVLVSLTTLAGEGWKSKIEEIEKLKIEEIALFLTGLEEKGRKELYVELKKTSVKRIPHVHIRTDMRSEELEFLIENFETQAFNLHPLSQYPLIHDYSKYVSRIFLENAESVPSDEDLKGFGGLCIDFAHWENEKLSGNTKYAEDISREAEMYPIGCCHVSAIKKKLTPTVVDWAIAKFDSHVLKDLAELDYLKKYKKYIPNLVSIELENPISKQLEAKKYIEGIITSKEKDNE